MTPWLIILAALLTPFALYGLHNSARIAALKLLLKHARIERDLAREEAQHWRNDASEQSQIIGRMRL